MRKVICEYGWLQKESRILEEEKSIPHFKRWFSKFFLILLPNILIKLDVRSICLASNSLLQRLPSLAR